MKTAVIYGATTTGKRVYEEVREKYEILYFVDGNPDVVGEEINGLEVANVEKLFEVRPDVVIMGIVTGYEDAAGYLVENGFEEEKIVVKYVDLNSRARRDCLDKIRIILDKKDFSGGGGCR